MLLDRYSPTPYHHATPKVGHLPPVKCPHYLSQSDAPPGPLPPLVKAHTKLAIQVLAAYPYLGAGYRNGDHCEIRVCIAASIGSLVWALVRILANANENVTSSNMHWFLNTLPILMHLAYLLLQTSRAGNACFHSTGSVATEQSWLLTSTLLTTRCGASSSSKSQLKQRLLHVWHDTDQTIFDNAIDEWRGCLRTCVRAKGGHFEQLLLQYSAILGLQETFLFLSNVTCFLDCFFRKKNTQAQIRTLSFAR